MPASAGALWHLASVQRFASGATICDLQMTWAMPRLWLLRWFCKAKSVMCDMMWLGLHIAATDELTRLLKALFSVKNSRRAMFTMQRALSANLCHFCIKAYFYISASVVFTVCEYLCTCSVHDDAVCDTLSCLFISFSSHLFQQLIFILLKFNVCGKCISCIFPCGLSNKHKYCR